MVFGVFDMLHPGHISFLKQARRHGEKLIIVVARDSVARRLKGKAPRFRERARIHHLEKELTGEVHVVLGDTKHGVYSAVKRYRPDMICTGYDQSALYQDLRLRIKKGTLPRISLRRLKAHKPKRFHTSILHK